MKKKFLGIICVLYSLIIVYVWLFDKLKNFLAPQMQIYIKISLFPLILMGLVLIFNNKVHYKFKVSDVVLIFPLMLLLFTFDGRLTTSLALNRMTNPNYNATFNQSKIDDYSESIIETTISGEEITKSIISEVNNIELTTEFDISNDNLIFEEFTPYFDIIDANYNELAYYITYNEKSSKYENEKIRVRGFTVTDSPYLQKDYFALGKYVISCCVADAGFTGFVLKYGNFEIKNSTWYEVEGILKKGKDIEDYDIMYIEITNIKEIDSKSEEQYVYPCYTYDNGLCKAVTQYNLER